jgi:acyl-CoA synthetase (AMP-forming)/AMP-acid ligase II
VVERISAGQIAFFPLAPLMHGAAQWTCWAWFLQGGKNILTRSAPRTDYGRVWQLITDHGVNVVTVIGDAVARPFIDEYLAHPDRYDSSTLFSISSGAVPLSPAGRAEIAATFPNVIINDGYGASETGAQAANTGDGRFASYDDETTVIDPATITEVVAGSGQQGRVARRGHIPLGYYGDSEKTAQTFVEKDGVRWVLTGDVAEILADGTIQLFGRGSMCINTGGEKVYPEEVENVLAGHPGVYDSLVVGVPDPRWGARVVAVVARAPGGSTSDADLEAYCREQLAGYKLPRAFVWVDEVRRSPAGKADYGWAKLTAEKALA